jgi:trigger factor
MQVTETLNEGLKRELKIIVAASDLEEQLASRLEQLKTQVQIKGFRPGKVPVSYLRKVHGRAVMGEIIEKTLSETLQNAVDERKEKPAFQPEIKFREEQQYMEDVIAGKSDLELDVIYEVLPEFEIQDFTAFTLTRPVADVTEDDINQSLKSFAEQNRQYEEKTGKAENNDRITIDFVGKIDGEPFENGSAEGIPLVLREKRFIPGVEEQLPGGGAGEERQITVTFPEDYQAENLAGKEAVFDIKVSKVEAPLETAIDDDMAKTMGFDNLGKLEEIVREQMEKDFGQISRQHMKRELLDAMDEAYDFELPPTLVNEEFEAIWRQLSEDMEKSGKSFEDEGTTEEEARSDYARIAERRVRLGLVLSEIGSSKDIQVTDEEMNRALSEHLRNFPGREQEAYQYYQKNPQALAAIRAPLFEEKVIDYILELVKIEEKKVSREELFRDPDADNDDGTNEAEDEKATPAKSKTKKKSKKKEA